MARFRIEQRAPGNPTFDQLPWEALAFVDARTADEALTAFFRANGWFTSFATHGQGLVHGVGHFRATPEDVTELHEFVILSQDPPGPHDQHLTWSDVTTLRAVDAGGAMRGFLDHHGWPQVQHWGDIANVTAVGVFRAVPADRVDEFRVTPAPTDREWND